MADLDAAGFMRLVAGRTGHFRLESGLHSRLWLDLDGLFADPVAVEPFIDALAAQLRPYRIDALCGPLVGGAFLAQRVAQALGAEFWYTERVDEQGDGRLFGARYRLPHALHLRATGRRVALVDDVMSAGSSLRATHAALAEAGAHLVAVGSLLQLGDVGADYFTGLGVPVEAPMREAFELWAPDACPLCRAGTPLLDPNSPAV
jgi:orotate phosphoribosyltransferase